MNAANSLLPYRGHHLIIFHNDANTVMSINPRRGARRLISTPPLSRKPRVLERCGKRHSITCRNSSRRYSGHFSFYRGRQRSSNVKFGEMAYSTLGQGQQANLTLKGQTYHFVLESDEIDYNTRVPVGYGSQKMAFTLQHYG